MTVSLYEGSEILEGDEGTALVAYNMKRSSANTPTAEVYHTPTVNDLGEVALVNARILPGGNSPQARVGGGIRQGIEWVLAPSTDYVLRAVNSSGSAVAVNLALAPSTDYVLRAVNSSGSAVAVNLALEWYEGNRWPGCG